MDGTNQPAIPKKGSSKMLLVGVVIAIVAIAAVAGAFLLLNNNGNKDNNNGNDNTNGGNNNTSGAAYELVNGEFMVWDTTSSFASIQSNSTTKWVVSNVTSEGYDATIYSYSSTLGQQTVTTVHGDYNTTLGSSDEGFSDNLGTKVGTEQLVTSFGTKTVDHYRNTTVDGTMTTTIDYYIGADTPVVYKMVMTMSDSEEPMISGTTTMAITDTNVDAVRNGNS